MKSRQKAYEYFSSLQHFTRLHTIHIVILNSGIAKRTNFN